MSFDDDKINIFKQRIAEIRQRIVRAAETAGRDPLNVHLVAVSKTISAERVRMAIAAGADILGENYVQEATQKFSDLSRFQPPGILSVTFSATKPGMWFESST